MMLCITIGGEVFAGALKVLKHRDKFVFEESNFNTACFERPLFAFQADIKDAPQHEKVNLQAYKNLKCSLMPT